MALTTGSRLGPYEILSALGAGGMGEVYRARDTKLGRDVAIKVMPDLLASDADRVARFRREAQVLAALNHPHIAAIYGFEDANESPALVLELVEGPTLADIIAGAGLPASGSRPAAMPEAQSPKAGGLALPLSDALNIARQIAEALEAAHEKGIIHRDLKPANVKLTADGKVKVLDFGLAKMLDTVRAEGSGPRADANFSMSPTLSVHATYAGVILGTASYMSPEQARGRPVDTRTDLWAFGCVLYEMLTGRKTFDSGDTVSDAVAAVLRADVNWSALPPDTPDSVRRLLRRCLEKDRSRRLSSASDARIEIEDAHAEPERVAAAPAAAVAPAVSRTRERVALGAAAVFALLAASAIAWALRPLPTPFETRLEITTPETDDPTSFAISPDGHRIVFLGSAAGGQSQLWLRPLDQTTAQPLSGTEGAVYPFWSPDSRSVAFFANNQLKRLDIGGGLPQTIATASNGGRGGAWNSDGVILIAPTVGPLLQVPATGGALKPAATFAPGQNGHRFPQFLPGGRQFVFYARGQQASSGLYLGSLDSLEAKRIGTADTSAMFAAPNWLIFLRQGTLFAQHFDLASDQLTGEPVTIADPVASSPALSAGAFSVSTAGAIAYRAGNSTTTQLTWFDRSGKVVGTIGQPDGNGLLQPTLSPDGRRVAAYRTVQNNLDLWLFDAARTGRFTFDTGREMYPLWSPDGSRIAFSKDAKGPLELYQKSASGAGQDELLLASPLNNLAAQSWSPDGRFLMYLERNPETAGDFWVLPLDGKQKPFVFLNSRFEERGAQFSPDGRWVAYASDESGRQEIYIRPFPIASGQWQVSTIGGVTPRWRRDGKELYYIGPDAKLMAVSVETKGTAPGFGTPMALFQTRIIYGGTSPVGIAWQYDVAPDGRFLINVNTNEAGTAPITVIQNWKPRQ